MITKYEAQTTLAALMHLAEQATDAQWDIRIRNDAWTLGEIIGHLVDSASNNHQRFVRLAFGDLKNFPIVYAAEPWVEMERYASMDRRSLYALWVHYNELLLHVAFGLTQEAMLNTWFNDDKEQSLEFLITDYYHHLQLHTDHFRDRLAEIRTYEQENPA